MFIAALFTTAKIWKQPKLPIKGEWVKKLWYIYNGILLGYKKSEILPFVIAWIDPKGVMLSEINHSEKEKYYMISLTCGI